MSPEKPSGVTISDATNRYFASVVGVDGEGTPKEKGRVLAPFNTTSLTSLKEYIEKEVKVFDESHRDTEKATLDDLFERLDELYSVLRHRRILIELRGRYYLQ